VRQEPTNHLDAGSVAWLERTLAGFRGTVVAVTHDRCAAGRAARRGRDRPLGGGACPARLRGRACICWHACMPSGVPAWLAMAGSES